MRWRHFLFLAAVVPPWNFAVSSPVLETGEIAGAKFTLARPARWNKGVLLIAPPFRAETRPLVADLFPDHTAYKTLREEGWIVAKTSYRRNGLIIADAISDLDALRAHIAETFGAPERVLLEGDSMGGLIVTLMAERPTAPRSYDGAVATGAALDLREPNSNLGLSLRPQIPLIFLSNQSELAPARAYVSTVPPGESAVPPVLFRVSRDGHVNVNQQERLLALRALNAWLDRGRTTLPRPLPGAELFDATVAPAAQPSQVTMHADQRGFDATVIEISAVFGNVFLNAQPGDFAAAGISKFTWLKLTANGKDHRVFYGRDFNSVKRGEWVVFPNADGFAWLARNFGDAAATANLQVGAKVGFRRFEQRETAAPEN